MPYSCAWPRSTVAPPSHDLSLPTAGYPSSFPLQAPPQDMSAEVDTNIHPRKVKQVWLWGSSDRMPQKTCPILRRRLSRSGSMKWRKKSRRKAAEIRSHPPTASQHVRTRRHSSHHNARLTYLSRSDAKSVDSVDHNSQRPLTNTLHPHDTNRLRRELQQRRGAHLQDRRRQDQRYRRQDA